MKGSPRILGAGLAVLLLGGLAARLWIRSPEPRPSAPAPVAANPPPAPSTAPREPAPPPHPSPRDPRPAAPSAPPRELLKRAGDILRAIFTRGALPPDVQRPHDYATNLPAGYFQLLVRAFPDEAFEVFSTEYLGDPEKATVAYWALGELARLRHGPTFDLFNAQLDGGDPVRARQALKALANYDVPQLGPRILARVPEEIEDADDADLLRTALLVAASISSVDPAALDERIGRYDRKAREEGIPDFYDTDEARRRAAVVRAADPAAALAELVRLDTRSHRDDLDRAVWAAERAVRGGHAAVAAAVRERIQKELERLRADDRLGDLDFLGRQRQGSPDVPSAGAFGGYEEARAIALLRRAVLNLGGALSDEEKRWLDGLRLLRSPREYLVEAGLIAP